VKTLQLTIIAILTSLNFFGQISKDTIVNGLKFNYKKYYDNGKLMELGNFNSKGRKTGQWIFYYDSGNIKEKGSFENDKKNGEWFSYDPNGDEATNGDYKKDLKVGEWWYHKHEIVWYKKGKIIKKGSGCKDCPPF